MRIRRLRFLVLLWVAATIGSFQYAAANLASPFPFDVEQPDGRRVTLFVRGNEHLNWYEYVPEIRSVNRAMLDTPQGRAIGQTPGFTVVRNTDGQYVYATRDENGNWAPTDSVAGQDAVPAGISRRTLPSRARVEAILKARMPHADAPQQVSTTGEVKNLVILMKFKDHAGRSVPTRQELDVIFNKVGGDPVLAPTGSVFDVYHENSYGKLKLKSTVVEWVTLPKTEKEYANGQSGLSAVIRTAIKDALNAVVAAGNVNFADFDNENGGVGDGRIDAITFVHSGYAAEFGGVDADGAAKEDRIWSHRWVLGTDWSANPAGVKVNDYNINPGLWSTSGSDPGRIGVICHELGHFFGLPDLYDYSGQGEGAGSWCLMANSWGFDGSQQHPPHFGAWSKLFLGWNQSVKLTSPGQFDVTATAVRGAQIYRVDFSGTPSSEYLLIENRQPIGNFEGGIPPGSDGVRGGLAIWHIDDAKPENDDPGFPGQAGWPGNGKHYMVGVLQADGKYDLEQGNNRGDGNDLFRAGFKDELTAATVPSSSAYGAATVPDITAISSSDRVMTFRFGEDDDPDDGGTDVVCCPTTARAVIRFGTEATENSAVTSVKITLNEDSVVHLTGNTSMTVDQDMTISTGFYDKPVPAVPADDEMWFESLRFISLTKGSWTNGGSTAAVKLPKGTHTIHWKVWVSAGTVKFDSGILLVEAFPLSAGSPGPNALPAPVRQPQTVTPADRVVVSDDATDGHDANAAVCSSGVFAALLKLIENTADSGDLRHEAIKVASDMARFQKHGCKSLGDVLSVVIGDANDDADVRRTAIEATLNLIEH